MKIKSLVAIILIIMICLISLTGCYSSQGLETLAYAVAIGIDKGQNDKIGFSVQLAILSNNSEGGSRKQPISEINGCYC